MRIKFIDICIGHDNKTECDILEADYAKKMEELEKSKESLVEEVLKKLIAKLSSANRRCPRFLSLGGHSTRYISNA